MGAGVRRGYRDLIAWQKGMDFAEQVYRTTHGWPREERYGLIDQARRASVSVPANIAEGQGRQGDREFGRFLGIAHGSLCEVETYLLLAHRLGYLDESTCDSLLEQAAEVGRLGQGLIRNTRQASPS